MLLAFSLALFLPTSSWLYAQEDAGADSVFTASVPYPRLPLAQPELFLPENQGWSLADRDSTLPPPIRMPLPRIQGLQRVEKPDSTGQEIIIAEQFDSTPVSIPIRMDYHTYFELRRKYNAHQLFVKKATQSLQYESGQGGRGLELVGAEIAGQRVSLRVAGNVNINARAMREDKNLITTSIQSQPTTNIMFNQQQNFNIEGRIGDRINVLVDYNSERDFQFENDVKINYTGDEDDIVQRIDAGNISLSLPGTQLVTFSPNSRGLFGIRTDMKIGPIDVVTVASIEQGKKEKLKYEGGSTQQEYSTQDYQYIKDRYFFLSRDYRQNFYPLRREDNLHTAVPNPLIINNIEVYKSVVGINNETGSQIPGVAWVDPNDKTKFPEYKRAGEFKILQPNEDYEVYKDLGYIRLNNVNLQPNEILAVAYNTEGGVDVGDINFNSAESDTITLKLLRPDNPSTSDPTWDLMFKNVYSLGTFDLDPDNLEFDIVDTYTPKNDNTNDAGVSWLRIFDLDRFNQSGELQPDDKLDNSPDIINYHRGEIFLPYLEPFRSSREAAAAGIDTFPGLYNPHLTEDLSQTQMYEGSYSTNNADVRDQSKFELAAKYSNQSSVINLGGFVIEGSEEVKLDGQTLQKGKDYTVDYFLGQIKIINEDALKPGADLEISYESNEVFQLDKKVVIGGRAEYKFGDNSFLAATGMYYSKSSIDDKVRVGQEPFSNFVWDVNGRFEQNLNFMTRAVDLLPLVRTEEPSRFQVEGEVAQVLPNPNTQDSKLEKNGVAYIDDFEGSKRTTTLTVFRGNWTESSAPDNMRRTKRGFMFWYNPYGGIATKNIWPDKETSVRLGNNTTDVLTLVLDPRRAIGDTTPTPQDSIWGGIMRPLPSSYRDQTESKFVEIWMQGRTGKIHLDLGRISEDINGNRVLDGEDKKQTIKTGYVKPEDDLGYDFLPDQEEVGVYNGDTLRYDSPASLFEKYGLLDKDPAGDNFQYNSRDYNDRQQYRYINGTQGNRDLADGRRVDTEDINGNNILDMNDNYFSYTIPVDTLENKYFVSETRFDDGQPTGWKQYRIPLSDFSKMVGNPQMDDIQFARLWVSDFPFTGGDQDTVRIARIEIVGNEWINDNKIYDVVNDTSRTDSSFAVTVINNEDNPEYQPPKGVSGARDRVNNITTKEQSLVLKMTNFDQWYEGKALKQLYKGQEASYVNYRHLKMFLHGDANFVSTGDHIEFFFRFGLNEENYYEYNTRLEPGWQDMDIDLDFLARLKTVDSLRVESGSVFPETNPRGYIYFEKNTIIFEDTTTARHEQLIVRGQPSLRKIAQMEVGARNYTNQDYQVLRETNAIGNWTAYTGEIWLNELRVTGVSRAGGRAMRVRATMDFADLASVNFSASRVDADFHRVDAQWGDQSNTEGFDINGTFNAHKFLPESWGLSIPLRAKYSQRVQNPKYLPGSDVLTSNLGETLPAEVVADTLHKIESFSMDRSYGASISKRSRSDNWLVKYSLDAVKFSYDVSRSYSRNDVNKYNQNLTTATQGSYGAQLPKGKPIAIFKFLQFMPMYGDELAESKFSYIPTKLDISAALSERQTKREGRYGEVGKKNSSSYSQVLRRNFATGYNPFNSLNFTFNKSVTSNVSDYRGGRRWNMIKYLKPGIITQQTENYGANYNLSLASWLQPTFRYQSNYNYAYNINSEDNAVDVAYTQRISMNLSLDLKKIKESIGGGSSNRNRPGGNRGRPNTGRPGRPTTPNQSPGDDQKKDEKKTPSLSEIFDSFLTKIQPINLTMNTGRQGRHNKLIHSPGIAYRMGLKVNADVPVDSGYIGQSSIRSISKSRDMSVRTGYNFSRNLSATFNFGRGTSESFQPNQSTRQLQQDFVLFQFSESKYDLRESFISGLPLPGWSIRWSGLEKFPLFSKFAQSVSLDHNFSGQYSSQWQDGVQRMVSYTQNLQPLVGLRFQLEHDISLNASFGTTKKVTESLAGLQTIDVSTRQNFSLSAGYQRRKGMHLPLPFLKDLNLDNNINFTFTFDYNKSLSRKKQDTNPFETYNDEYSWQVQPKIDYSFTSKVTGGIYYKFGRRYNAQRNNAGKPTKFSDFGLTVNIQIRG